MSMEWADVHVSFRAMIAPPTESLSAEMEARLALQRVGKGEVSRSRWENTRWCLVRVPTPEWAALIDEPFDVLLDEFFGGCLTEWASVKPRWDELCTQLSLTSSIRILSADTDLTFGVGGRTWVSFAGEANLPDGEVATAPRETEVNGYITFSGSFWFAGVEVRDLRLEFVAGLVTTVAATRGAAFVEKLLDSDEGARRVGELGIGTNRLVRTVTGDLLIDEKILGSAHFALGRSYPQCGGLNLSSLHWDIVKDLRFSDCFVYADGVELIAGGVPVGILDAATRSL
jgi:aminopeptidase